MRGLLWQVRQEMSVLHGKLGGKQGLRRSTKSCTRKEHESATNSIAQRGQGGTSSLFVCPLQGQGTASLVGFGATPQQFHGRPASKRTQQRRRQRSVPASNFARPQTRSQAALPPRFRDEQKCRTLCTTLCITKENGQYQQTYPQNRAKNADLVNSVCITDEKLPKDTG